MMHVSGKVALYLLIFLSVSLSAHAQYTPGVPVPRILMVGDSWAGFMQAFKSFDTVMPEYPGLENCVQVGYQTSFMGSKAEDLVDKYLGLIADAIAEFPTVDVVALSLGGNDFLRGSRNSPRWNPGMTPQQETFLIGDIAVDVGVVIDHILAQRPDLRIVLYSYTFSGRSREDCTIVRQNNAFSDFERAKKFLADARDRVDYVLNLGLMQYAYGTEETPDGEGGTLPALAPGVVPLPGSAPDYVPFPGGDVRYNAPQAALIDGDIHLTSDGYEILARRIMDQYIASALNHPRAIEILPLELHGGVLAFQVTFTKPVMGVEDADFSVLSDTGSPSIAGVSGDGAVYLVTVNLGGAQDVRLVLLDDDSIVDGDSRPLGGPGAGNGGFTHNGPFDYVPMDAPADDDFEGALRFFDLVSTPYLDQLNEFSFAPEFLDANGGDVDLSSFVIGGNGVLELYEFSLITAAAGWSGLDHSARGGITQQGAASVWEHNLARMQSDLGGEEGIAASVLPGMDTVMAGYMTLGDPDSYSLPIILLFYIAGLEEFPIDVSVPNVLDYQLHAEWFGPDGDADADGFRNRTEYHALGAARTLEAYHTVALDSTRVPDHGVYAAEEFLHAFSAIDTDLSGLVALAEATAFMPSLGAQDFGQLDLDGSGDLSVGDLLAPVAESLLDDFFALDNSPADGFLSQREARRRPLGLSPDIYNSIDADSDGRVTREEVGALIPCQNNPERCSKPYGGLFETGDDLCLCVPCPVSVTSGYTWMKDGVPLSDGGRIQGVSARTLHILMLTTGDSGRYACLYEDGAKVQRTFEAQVIIANEVPVAGLSGIALLALLCAGAAAVIHRKRA